MWYKEWRQARLKILTAVVTYTLITLYSVVNWLTTHWGNILNSWLVPAIFATGILAALGGIDAVSEEKDRGTMSFLLTRPLDRAFVYSTKLLVNLSWLCGIYGFFSFLILGLSRLQFFYFSIYYDPYYAQNYHNLPIYFGFTLPWSLSSAVTLMLLILASGIAITCYTAFVSIFARNTLETIVYSVLIIMSLVISGIIIYIVIDSLFYDNHPMLLPQWIAESPGFLLGSLGLIGLASIFFGSGRAVFRRKEF